MSSETNGTLVKPKDLLYPRSQPGGWERVPKGSASCQQRGGGSPPRMVSQPPGWELVGARAVS
ncbi:hypothetical protein [Nostoc sp.]